MGSKHSRARDARQRKYRVARRRVMREFGKALNADATAAKPAESGQGKAD